MAQLPPPPPAPASTPTDVLEVWKQAQEMHRHFNTILFQIRNIAFVFAGAVLAGVAALFKVQSDREVGLLGLLKDATPLSETIKGCIKAHDGKLDSCFENVGLNPQLEFVGPLLLVAALVWFMLYLLDRFYYHVLLIGTGQFIQGVERAYPALGLSTMIRNVNRQQPFPVVLVSSGRKKISVFYAIPLVLLISFGTLRLSGDPRVAAAAAATVIAVVLSLELWSSTQLPE